MAKNNQATRDAVAHGDVRSKLHQKHKRQQQQRKEQIRREKQAGVQWIKRETYEEGELWPLFESCLEPFLGPGETFRINRNEKGEIVGLKAEEGKGWQSSLNSWQEDMSWYSIPKKLKGGVKGWTRRKIRDREKRSKTDKKDRPDTDVLRITNELRPDHTRALFHMCEAGKTTEAQKLIEEFYWRSSAKWEELHPGRLGDHVGGHLDSGHVHRDLWHSGTTEHQDDTAPDNLRRDRVPYTSYGVGPGSTAFVRHIHVMVEAFGETEDCVALTVSEMDSNIAKAKAQNKCDPRDLAFNEWLDTWMQKELSTIDPGIAQAARLEYAEHVRSGYRVKKLGIHAEKSTAEYEAELKEKNNKIAELESSLTEQTAEVEDLKTDLAHRDEEIVGLKAERDNSHELVELGKLLSEEMAADAEPEQWISESASLAQNGRSYLNWIKAGPERLITRIRNLIRPIQDKLLKMADARTFLELLGFSIPKQPNEPSRQIGNGDGDVKVH